MYRLLLKNFRQKQLQIEALSNLESKDRGRHRFSFYLLSAQKGRQLQRLKVQVPKMRKGPPVTVQMLRKSIIRLIQSVTFQMGQSGEAYCSTISNCRAVLAEHCYKTIPYYLQKIILFCLESNSCFLLLQKKQNIRQAKTMLMRQLNVYGLIAMLRNITDGC